MSSIWKAENRTRLRLTRRLFSRRELVYEFDTSQIRFSYASPTTPQETYDYDVVTRRRTLVKRQTMPRGFDPQAYVARLVFALAEDGERAGVATLQAGSEARWIGALFITGYGAYGYAAEASFATNRFSLVDRGFMFAIAHVRGGTDKGWRWYEDGNLSKKPNTFGDFLAAVRFLIAEGFTSKGQVVAQGGSAGGMLMGAIANLAPDLFAEIIADVPFVDVLATMLDASLPLTPPEWLEWGDPIHDKAAFETIRAYSPIDNVRAQRFPGDPGACRIDRSACDLLGAGQMGCAAAYDNDRRRSNTATHGDGRGTCGRVGAVRPA